ncbi:MAG: helix-turn-helix domain-containing protein [Syntrophobacteraceae bacterium]
MSYACCPYIFLAHKRFSANTKIVAIALKSHDYGNPDEQKGFSWPSIETLMAKTSLSKKTVIECLKDLKKELFLKVIRDNRQDTNMYVNRRPVFSPKLLAQRFKLLEYDLSINHFEPIEYPKVRQELRHFFHHLGLAKKNSAVPDFEKIEREALSDYEKCKRNGGTLCNFFGKRRIPR